MCLHVKSKEFLFSWIGLYRLWFDINVNSTSVLTFIINRVLQKKINWANTKCISLNTKNKFLKQFFQYFTSIQKLSRGRFISVHIRITTNSNTRNVKKAQHPLVQNHKEKLFKVAGDKTHWSRLKDTHDDGFLTENNASNKTEFLNQKVQNWA